MNKDDRVYLRHILDRIRRIEEDTVDGRERFMASHTLQDAVLRSLQVMAESTPKVYRKQRKRHSPTSNGERLPLFETSWFMTTLGLTWIRSGTSLNKTSQC
jgi:hypothetical protein